MRQSCCAPQKPEQHPSAREDLAKSSMAYSEGKDGEAPPLKGGDVRVGRGGYWAVLGYEQKLKKKKKKLLFPFAQESNGLCTLHLFLNEVKCWVVIAAFFFFSFFLILNFN